MNLAQAIDPRTGHIDTHRVAVILLTEHCCGCTLTELLAIHRASVRRHEHRGPPGQGNHDRRE